MSIKNKKLFFSLFALYIAVMLLMCAIGTIPAGSNTWSKGAKIYFPYSENVITSYSIHYTKLYDTMRGAGIFLVSRRITVIITTIKLSIVNPFFCIKITAATEINPPATA